MPLFLDKLELAPEDRRVVTVKTHNEAALHLQTRALDALHVRHQVALLILALVALEEAGGIGRLDADEHGVKTGLDHLAQQGVIVGQIDRSLGVEREAVAVRFLPLDQPGQQLRPERCVCCQ